MADARIGMLLRQARLLSPSLNLLDLGDAELLARFLDQRDEVAFEAIVLRHGPMVRTVCRAALRNAADGDDAFQATFLVLVRRAAAIRDRAALGGWLYRVAHRVSRKLRDRTKRFNPLTDDLAVDGTSPGVDLRSVLDEEIAKLPEKYRLVVQLCYVNGLTTTVAAQRLGSAKGTVLTRLAWARKRLRGELTRRGVTVAVGSLGVVLGRTGTGAVPIALVLKTVQAAGLLTAGESVASLVSERTITLTQEVVQVMILNKVKWVAGILLLTVTLTGVGIGRWSATTATAEPGDKPKIKAVASEFIAAGEAKPGPDAKPTADDEKKPTPKTKEFAVTRPIGTWVREAPGSRTILVIGEDRVSATFEKNIDNTRFSGTFEADYSLNKESVIFGVVSSDDSHVDTPPDVNVRVKSMTLIGEPFAIRFRVDGDTLTLKDLKGLDTPRDRELNNSDNPHFLMGRYQIADPKQPVANTPLKPGKRPTFYYGTAPPRADTNYPQPVPEVRYTVPAEDGQLPPPTLPSRTSPSLPPSDRILPSPQHERSETPRRTVPDVIPPNTSRSTLPTDREILRQLPKLAKLPIGEISIVKNRILDKIECPKVYPVVGLAKLHRQQWDCAVYYTETAPNADANCVKKNRVNVVYLDKNDLIACKE